MTSDGAAWLAAIGTVGTLAVVLSIELRNAAARRSEQAALVSVWFNEADSWAIVVSNKSSQPVYDFCVGWYDPASHYDSGRPGVAWQTTALAPGVVIQTGIRLPTRMGQLPSLMLEFTDRNGVWWRREGGSLRALRRKRRLLPVEGRAVRVGLTTTAAAPSPFEFGR